MRANDEEAKEERDGAMLAAVKRERVATK